MTRRALLLTLLALGLAGCRGRAVAANSGAIGHEYDLQYAIARGAVLTDPSPFLVSSLRWDPPAPAAAALDIGSGSGRNSLYLARRGFRVTAVDLSQVGLDLTRQQALAARLPVTTVHADINRFPVGRARWNLIVLVDFPFPYQALLPRLAAGLKPGGMIVVQAVSSLQPQERSPDGLLRYTFMRRSDLDLALRGFRVLDESEARRATVWGVPAIMLRLAARKSAR